MMVLRRARAGWPSGCSAARRRIVVGTLAILGCLYLLVSLPSATLVRFVVWNAIGLVGYLAYGRRHGLAARH